MEPLIVGGADPELMVQNPQGELISAIPLIVGTKDKPLPIEQGALQHDGVLAEFNIDPARTPDEFLANIKVVLRQMAELLAPNRLIVQASANYPAAALEEEEARRFGCDPDFNSWSLSMNVIAAEAALSPFRSSGGHFHFGYTEASQELLTDPYGKAEVIKAADVFQGIPSIFIDSDPTAQARRSLYGRAGAHRPKEYGVEYRALGNFWVKSPGLARMVFQLGNAAVRAVLANTFPKIASQIGGDVEIQRIINDGDKVVARKVYEEIIAPHIPRETQLLVEAAQTLHASINFYEAWELPSPAEVRS